MPLNQLARKAHHFEACSPGTLRFQHYDRQDDFDRIGLLLLYLPGSRKQPGRWPIESRDKLDKGTGDVACGRRGEDRGLGLKERGRGWTGCVAYGRGGEDSCLSHHPLRSEPVSLMEPCFRKGSWYTCFLLDWTAGSQEYDRHGHKEPLQRKSILSRFREKHISTETQPTLSLFPHTPQDSMEHV